MQAQQLGSVQKAADLIVERTGGRIILGLPLGTGKPNQLVNELYRRAVADPAISLEILTALSLARPAGGSDLERRFLGPFVERVFGDYVELEYLSAMRRNRLPANVQVHEFYVAPASELGNSYSQRNYISSNYTHAPRDIAARGVNVLAQAVASRETADGRELSLSCNPEITLALERTIRRRRGTDTPVLTVAVVNRQLPFMVHDAIAAPDLFDLVVDDPACHTALFSTPNMPVGMAEHFIGMHASTLVKDGGTLQIGIGALGDAVAGALLLRHEDNAAYRSLVQEIRQVFPASPEVAAIGELAPFAKGLYGCSEMFTYGLFELFRRGLIKRGVDYRGGEIAMHGGFFLGPTALYEGLHRLSETEMRRICMTNINYVNHLYGSEDEKRRFRRDARFINTAFTITLLGAGVADQLDDGRILSGVGGQYNFVAQAHELDGGRSVMLVRATRERSGELASNIVWNYGHTTIPRHLRDIVVTEYGVADLRGKSDSEIIKAMLNITDSRFQPALLEQARKHLKLEADYQIPVEYRNNTAASLRAIYDRARARSLFPPFPLGTDFNFTEQVLLQALGWLKSKAEPRFLLELARKSMLDESVAQHFRPHLTHMGLWEPTTLKERIYRRMLLAALHETADRG